MVEACGTGSTSTRGPGTSPRRRWSPRAAGSPLPTSSASCIAMSKPDNVMVAADGTVRLVDFGLAHAGPDDTRTVTQRAGAARSPPSCTAPSAIWRRSCATVVPPDARSDQLALCRHAARGALPPTRTRAPADPGATVASLGCRSTAGRRGRRARHVVRAIERGLAADPLQRHASMEALLAELVPCRPPRAGMAVIAALAHRRRDRTVAAPSPAPWMMRGGAGCERERRGSMASTASPRRPARRGARGRPRDRERLRRGRDREGAIAAESRGQARRSTR